MNDVGSSGCSSSSESPSDPGFFMIYMTRIAVIVFVVSTLTLASRRHRLAFLCGRRPISSLPSNTFGSDIPVSSTNRTKARLFHDSMSSKSDRSAKRKTIKRNRSPTSCKISCLMYKFIESIVRARSTRRRSSVSRSSVIALTNLS